MSNKLRFKTTKKGTNPALLAANQIQRDNVLITAANRVNLAVTLNVLADYFDFPKEDLVRFKEKYELILQARATGNLSSCQDLMDILKEEYDIEI